MHHIPCIKTIFNHLHPTIYLTQHAHMLSSKARTHGRMQKRLSPTCCRAKLEHIPKTLRVLLIWGCLDTLNTLLGFGVLVPLRGSSHPMRLRTLRLAFERTPAKKCWWRTQKPQRAFVCRGVGTQTII